MKRFLSVLFFIFIFKLCLFSQDYYTDDFKDFTFEMPDGWETMLYPGLKYKIIYGDSVHTYNQNMIFISQEETGSLEKVIKDYMEKIKNNSPDFKIIKAEKFENKAQLEAEKLVIEITQDEIDLKLYFYMFKHNTMLFICSAALPIDDEFNIEELFDASMKTFQILDKEE